MRALVHSSNKYENDSVTRTNNRYDTDWSAEKELSFVKIFPKLQSHGTYEDIVVDRDKKTASKTPAHYKKKSSMTSILTFRNGWDWKQRKH